LLYIFFGADDFSRRESLAELKKELGDPGLLSLNTTVLDGTRLTLEQLRNACEALPFLGQKRLVLVEGLLSRFERRASPSDSASPSREENVALLADFIHQIPPTTVLVLVEERIREDNPLFQRLASGAVLRSFPPLRGVVLQQWIRDRVTRGGGTISPQAVKALVELVGENLWILAAEIEKLLLYARGRGINAEDVRKVVAYAREANIFAMVDAILEGNVPRALRQLHQLLQEGVAPPYLLVMLTRQFRLLLRAKVLSAAPLSPAELRERLGVAPNYPLDRLLRQSRGYSLEQLGNIYQRLLETDLAIKTGRWRDELALDLLVVGLGAGKRT
jgi:DNA polymerase-3 subunit delta